MCYEHVHFLEAALVQKHGDTLTGGVLAALVLLLNGFLAAAQTGLGAELYELLNLFCLFAHCDE